MGTKGRDKKVKEEQDSLRMLYFFFHFIIFFLLIRTERLSERKGWQNLRVCVCLNVLSMTDKEGREQLRNQNQD